jgi:NAD(P)-dependent dehydrogenase (short-subunit alcohol dehydrogenase family)
MSTRFDGLPEVLKNVRTRPLFVMHLNVRPLVIVGATPGVNRRVGLTQKLLPLINDGGRIVMLSSGTTRIIFPGSGAYASMKGAIEILALYLAKELGPRRIAVNTVAPGAIATDFSGGMVRDNPEVNKIVAGMTALGRAGLPDDVGPMIASLLSDDNRWVNAQRIEVSGGMSI